MRAWIGLSAMWLLAVGCDAGGAPARPPEAAPPFALRGDLAGLHLVWFDEDGLHTAESRDDIPEAHRGQVRVESLAVPPSERLDPSRVWLADLRAPGPDGAYPVRAVPREALDRLVSEAAPAPPPRDEVVLYSASWCDACKAAGRFLRERGVPFVEKDVERDPGAHAEMVSKLREAGLPQAGIPVLDVRGTMVQGFDAARLGALLDGA